ncbi:hypothetical protein Tco_0690710 [Tanacetum coccineum]
MFLLAVSSEDQYAVSIKEDTAMDDPNLTMEEYIRTREEKALKRGNGKCSIGKMLHMERSGFDDGLSQPLLCEAEFQAIVFNDCSCTSDVLQCKSHVNSENDYEKVMPSLPSPEPAISCFDDLDLFSDSENEFPAIVYNDATMSKLDLLN